MFDSSGGKKKKDNSGFTLSCSGSLKQFACFLCLNEHICNIYQPIYSPCCIHTAYLHVEKCISKSTPPEKASRREATRSAKRRALVNYLLELVFRSADRLPSEETDLSVLSRYEVLDATHITGV